MQPGNSIDRQSILNDIIHIISDMTQDWENELSGPISGETCLIKDLGFESIDVVMLTGEIHRYYTRKKFPFERLFISQGRYVDDVRISTLVDFLYDTWSTVPTR
ncbi:MAG TPA: acyl carrier protein [Nitrospiria bacterium]|nr:acyl carrier protein [Nitrospiria bacterium]